MLLQRLSLEPKRFPLSVTVPLASNLVLVCDAEVLVVFREEPDRLAVLDGGAIVCGVLDDEAIESTWQSGRDVWG